MVILLIFSSAYLPWWAGGLIALVAIWRFDSGYELVLPTLLVDLVYGRPILASLQFAFPTTLLLLILITLHRLYARQFFFRFS